MSLALRNFAIAAGLVLAPAPALAQELGDLIKASDCPSPGAIVSNDTIRDRLFDKAGLKMSSQVARLFANGQLGDEARRRAEQCGRLNGDVLAKCTDQDKAFADLFDAAASLSSRLSIASPTIAVSWGAGRPDNIYDLGVAFLNGNFAWISVSCANEVAQGPKPPPPPPAQAFNVIIAKSESDAPKSFDKREFASIGLDSDRVKDVTAFSADAFVGFGRVNSAEPTMLFISYQRKTPSSKQDDLALGVSATRRFEVGGLTNNVTGLLAWETDDRFRSSLWRGQAGVGVPINFCEDSNRPGKWYASCDATLLVDYSDVVDPGRKAALLNRDSFTRGGLDLSASFMVGRGDKLGFYTFSTGYQIRRDISGEGADAELFTASIGLTAGDKSHFKVSLDYSEGEDLTSLGRIDVLKLSLGYRQ